MDLELAINRLNEELSRTSLGSKPDELYEPVRYFLQIGGKRMRPLLTLLGCYLFDRDYDKALKPSLAVELFHNFSLIHDDIMDKAPLRRGFKTIHEKWNTNIAILAGDVMLIEAYEMLAYVPEKVRADIYKKFNLTAKQVCEGQQLDMNFETLQDVSIQDYIQMIAFKTAVLLAFSMYMGAKIGGAPQNDADKLYNCALNLGISFQIKDDWLDLYGEASLVGKQIGGDILANKKTFLLLTALDKANPTQKASLQRLMQDKCINPDDKIAATTAIFQELNISEITQQEIKKYFNMAIESLDTINAEKGKIAYLKNYFIELFNRQK